MPRPGVSAAWLWLAATAFAQITGGVMTGVVEDPSGAIIPGASVTVINESTGMRP